MTKKSMHIRCTISVYYMSFEYVDKSIRNSISEHFWIAILESWNEPLKYKHSSSCLDGHIFMCIYFKHIPKTFCRVNEKKLYANTIHLFPSNCAEFMYTLVKMKYCMIVLSLWWFGWLNQHIYTFGEHCTHFLRQTVYTDFITLAHLVVNSRH